MFKKLNISGREFTAVSLGVVAALLTAPFAWIINVEPSVTMAIVAQFFTALIFLGATEDD